jgi:hypothetical protein
MEVYMKKLYLITFLLTSIYTFSSSAGPTGDEPFDPLITSYLTAVELAKDGNINAVKNREVIYSFLNKEQQLVVHNLYLSKVEKDIAIMKLNKILKTNKVIEVRYIEKKHTELSYLKPMKANKFIFF